MNQAEADKLIRQREAVVKRWCVEHGKDEDKLSMEDVLAIRALPDWKNAREGVE